MQTSGDPLLPTALAALASAAIGDRYAIGKQVGAGANATVFLARDLKHRRSVAIKVLREEIAAGVGSDRFEREVLIAAGLTHPNILPVFDSGSERGIFYYVMPYIAGETLADRLKREGLLPVSEAVQLTREIGAALQHAHDHGLVHRDVKPANVLLSGGVAVVADFGLARAIEGSSGALEITSAGTAVGTPLYMSPEQAVDSARVDARADQYGLACVLYEMLTGRPPYQATTFQALIAQHVTADPPDASLLRPEVPARLTAAIVRALAKSPDDRFPSVAAFVETVVGTPDAAASGDRKAAMRRLSARSRIGASAVAAVLVAAGAWALWNRFRPAEPKLPLDKDLVAVAPFTAPEPQLAIWREGLAEVVARNLDGAGPLRTVSMTVVSEGWRGDGDQRAMRDLGRRTRAGSIVSGTLLRRGADSVQITATVYDVAGLRSLGAVNLTEDAAQMGRLAERFTIEVLRRLGKSEELATARMVAARATPLPALKAFLQGEFYFRRTAWDSAMANYRRATELDPSMALAFLRMSMVAEWQRATGDSITDELAQRAAQLNHGLAPRESLLVQAEALKARIGHRFADSAYASHVAQLFQTLETATRLYPDDREFWYSLGNARANLSGKIRSALSALDRSIAIDSGFAPSYLDAVTLAMALGATGDARRYLGAYLTLHPSDVHGDGLRLASQLLDPGVPAARSAAVLDTASAKILIHAIDVLAYWPDSAEVTVHLARLLRDRSLATPAYYDTAFTAFQLAYPLAFRGHLSEAFTVFHGRKEDVQAVFVGSLVMMGAIPDDMAARYFAALKDERMDVPNGLVLALPWWSAHRDTLSLRSTAERAESASHKSRNAAEANGARYARYLGAAARAYLALSRADTTDALARLLALDATDCMFPYCPYEALEAATLLSQRHRDADAWQILDDVPNFYGPLSVRWRLQRALVAERLGRRDEALSAYEYVTAAWQHADALLQPEVAAAEAGRRRLGAGKRGSTP